MIAWFICSNVECRVTEAGGKELTNVCVFGLYSAIPAVERAIDRSITWYWLIDFVKSIIFHQKHTTVDQRSDVNARFLKECYCVYRGVMRRWPDIRAHLWFLLHI